MNEHTKGLVKYIPSTTRHRARIEFPEGQIANDEDMRRMAACWNACLCVSTEQLESIEAEKLSRSVTQHFASVVRQRDQLLEALHTIQHSISQAKVFGNDWRRELVLIEEVANTAIAAVNRGES